MTREPSTIVQLLSESERWSPAIGRADDPKRHSRSIRVRTGGMSFDTKNAVWTTIRRTIIES
jgi:hypothetical protein